MDRTLDDFFKENQVLLNPALPELERLALQQAAAEILQKRNLKHHVVVSTSGSTQPVGFSSKLVFLSRQALETSAASVNLHLQVSKSDKWLNVLPEFHVGGLGVIIRALLSQSSVYSWNQEWKASAFVDLITQQGVTLTSLVPTQVYDLVRGGLIAPRSLRAVVVGGGALESGLWRQARELGWPLLPSFGMSETCSQIATTGLQDLDKIEISFPQLLNHVHLSFEDEHVWISSKSLLTCYGQIQNSQVVHWDPKDGSGRFLLEDHIRFVGDNRIQVLGRGGDFIKISGESLNLLSLREKLTEAVQRHTDKVSEYLLMVEKDSRHGQSIVLVTTVRDEILCKKISDAYRDLVLPVAKIRKVRYIQDIPRSPLGKVLWGQINLNHEGEE